MTNVVFDIFHNFDESVLINIFSFLNLESLFSVLSVSKKSNDLVQYVLIHNLMKFPEKKSLWFHFHKKIKPQLSPLRCNLFNSKWHWLTPFFDEKFGINFLFYHDTFSIFLQIESIFGGRLIHQVGRLYDMDFIATVHYCQTDMKMLILHLKFISNEKKRQTFMIDCFDFPLISSELVPDHEISKNKEADFPPFLHQRCKYCPKNLHLFASDEPHFIESSNRFVHFSHIFKFTFYIKSVNGLWIGQEVSYPENWKSSDIVKHHYTFSPLSHQLSLWKKNNDLIIYDFNKNDWQI